MEGIPLLFFFFVVFGAFAKLRKATVGFLVSVCLSVSPPARVEQLGSHWTDGRMVTKFDI
jgi:hypothetical protein